MKSTCLKSLIVLLMTVVVSAPLAWAKEKGYCYVVSYSLRQKVVFITPVFTADVSGALYSDEEFVADVELIRKIENQFQQHLTNVGLNSSDYITEARVGYRTQAIATQRLTKEKNGFEGRGFRIKKTGSFSYIE